MGEFIVDADWRNHLAELKIALLERTLSGIERDAVVLAPEDSGYLKSSAEHTVHDEDSGEVRFTAGYAAAVNNGHRVVSHGVDTGHQVPPQPFLDVALYAERDLGE